MDDAAHDAEVERVLRERTDVFEHERRILAIAARPEIERVLARLPQGRCRRAAALSREALRFDDCESFDVAIADAGAVDGSGGALRELARMLRPGGRLVVRVGGGAAADLTQRLAGAGFFVSRAAEGRGATVLVAVRGEFAAYAR